MNREELAWAAGFFDGEGHTGVQRKHGQVTGAHMGIKQTDPQALLRFQAAVGGLGTVTGPYLRTGPNHAPIWNWQSGGWKGPQAVIAMLWTFLGPVKRGQAARVLSTCHSRPRRDSASKTHCKNGHPLSGRNLRLDTRGHRQCVTCIRARWRHNHPFGSRYRVESDA